MPMFSIEPTKLGRYISGTAADAHIPDPDVEVPLKLTPERGSKPARRSLAKPRSISRDEATDVNQS